MKQVTSQSSRMVPWLYAHGYSFATAAKELGVTRLHLAKVLRGERESKSLMERVKALPKRTPLKPTKHLPEIQ